MKKLFYISTNEMWSGSEELWTRSASLFQNQGYEIVFSAVYQHKQLDILKAERVEYYKNYIHDSLIKRKLNRIGLTKKEDSNTILKSQLLKLKPALVVISQGNNINSLDIMLLCKGLNIPYITLTQLVTEVHYLYINEENLPLLKLAYKSAKANYFVSGNNLALNNRMIGIDLSNAEIVFNPCKLKTTLPPLYPLKNEIFHVGMVGRIECFHKGYDVLFQVICQEKWRSRLIQFNIYGEGPHLVLLEEIAKTNRLNVFFKKHIADVTTIWAENHLLLMTSRMEGQSLSLIEAMWCQRAAIVTNVGGAAELIEDGVNGFIADACTVTSIDNALESAWLKRDSWEEMGKEAAKILLKKHPINEVVFFNNKVEPLFCFDDK